MKVGLLHLECIGMKKFFQNLLLSSLSCRVIGSILNITFKETLNKLIPFMVRQAQDERSQHLTVRPGLAPLALLMVVEGLVQGLLK